MKRVALIAGWLVLFVVNVTWVALRLGDKWWLNAAAAGMLLGSGIVFVAGWTARREVGRP